MASYCLGRRRCLQYFNRIYIGSVRNMESQPNKENDFYSSSKETHFGFDRVSEKEKQEKVNMVFNNVASRYDVMNDAMSFGLHRLWKDYFIRVLNPTPGTQLLDVAGGTGDIAFRFLNHINTLGHKMHPIERSTNSSIEVEHHIIKNNSGKDTEEVTLNTQTGALQKPWKNTTVTVCDINQAMLDVGKQRAEQTKIYNRISWVCGNAEQLLFEDNTFDAYTIAFGIRNVVRIDQVLKEAYRVLKPGGRFLCLEFSQVNNSIVNWAYKQYSFQAIPVMGLVISQDWKSYQYLVESIEQFPNQETFKNMIKSAGFKLVTYENLTFGVVAIHSGFKL